MPTRFALVGAALCAAPSLLAAQSRVFSTARFTAGAMEVTVVFRDAEVGALENELRTVLTGGLNRYEALFGGPPRNPDGTSTDRLLVDVTSAPLGEGDADPGIIRLTVGRRSYFGFYDWQLTLLHEAFHLWNAESFRYADGREQWFNEGASEFYALQTAASLGLIAPDRVPAVAGMVAGFYAGATGLGELSLRDAGATPELKRDHYFLVYHGGWIALLVLDHDIRRRTANLHSLDEVMRRLYRLYDARRRRYDMHDLVEALRLASGASYEDFFARYIDGRETIPVADRFDAGALAMTLSARASGLRPRAALDTFLLASLGIRP